MYNIKRFSLKGIEFYHKACTRNTINCSTDGLEV